MYVSNVPLYWSVCSGGGRRTDQVSHGDYSGGVCMQSVLMPNLILYKVPILP